MESVTFPKDHKRVYFFFFFAGSSSQNAGRGARKDGRREGDIWDSARSLAAASPQACTVRSSVG